MLDQQLIDIINSGNAWAFIGSGFSVDSGFPSWDALLHKVITQAKFSIGSMPADVLKRVQKRQNKHKLPEAFSLLKSHYGNSEIDSIVCRIFNISTEPGEVTKTLAQWPFTSYVTTNYDSLLERALEPFGGWVAVGNTSDENTKISGDVRQVVWHPHGGADLGTKNVRLVLASKPQCCIKKMEKTSPNVMGIEFSANPGLVTGKNQWCIPGSVRFFPSFLPFGKAGGLQIRRCQGLAAGLLRLRPWRLGSEALRLLQRWGKDYDEIYPAGSPTLAALEAVCRMKRIVFFGFGFRDPDLIATLKRVSRLVTPARPAYGFLANCNHEDRKRYWEQYKINIISYKATETDVVDHCRQDAAGPGGRLSNETAKSAGA